VDGRCLGVVLESLADGTRRSYQLGLTRLSAPRPQLAALRGSTGRAGRLRARSWAA